jgi:hypothetical protein
MKEFRTFFWRITSAHVVTYFLAGLMAFYLLNYGDMFEKAPYSYFMKPANSPAVAAGPALQVIRGLIFSLALWPFRNTFLNTKYGWIKLWGLLIGLSVLSTTAAGPGSVEGFIYTTIPVKQQIAGYLEVVPQTLLFSILVYYWYKKPTEAWQIISIILVAIVMLLSILGVIMANPKS